jgi:hypothetical protein
VILSWVLVTKYNRILRFLCFFQLEHPLLASNRASLFFFVTKKKSKLGNAYMGTLYALTLDSSATDIISYHCIQTIQFIYCECLISMHSDQPYSSIVNASYQCIQTIQFIHCECLISMHSDQPYSSIVNASYQYIQTIHIHLLWMPHINAFRAPLWFAQIIFIHCECQ